MPQPGSCAWPSATGGGSPSPSAGRFHTPALDLPETSTHLQPSFMLAPGGPAADAFSPRSQDASSLTLPGPGFPLGSEGGGTGLRPRAVSSRAAAPEAAGQEAPDRTAASEQGIWGAGGQGLRGETKKRA